MLWVDGGAIYALVGRAVAQRLELAAECGITNVTEHHGRWRESLLDGKNG